MKKPPELNFGPKKLRKWAEEIAAVIAQLTPMPGIGTTIQEDPNGGGFSVNVKVQNGDANPASPCVGLSRTEYNLTLAGFECVVLNTGFIFPTSVADTPDGGWYGGCVWQWIGDASSSSEYSMAGPDVLSLGRFLDTGDMTVKWNIRASTIATPAVFADTFIDVDAASPVGDYNAGYGVIS